MIPNKDTLVEYILERFATLETEYEDARRNQRESFILIIQGQMMELNSLYMKVAGSNDLNKRMMVVFKRKPFTDSP